MRNRLIRDLAQRAAAGHHAREKRAFYGYPGMMGMGPFPGMTTPGYCPTAVSGPCTAWAAIPA